MGEVLTMFLSMIMGLPIPLLPAQVLAVNLATDGLPAIALGMEPGEPDIMERPPRSPDESIFSHGLARLIMVRGIFIAISTIASFMIVNTMSKNLAGARTAALVTLVLSQLIHVFECKSEHKSLFELPVFSNKYLTLLGIIYLPFLSAIFGTTALALNEWLIAGGISLLVPILVGIVGAKKTMPMEEAGLEHN